MIKSFHRSDAGAEEQLPSDLRPPQALRRALQYLWDNYTNSRKNLAENHKFVWDRTRAIRNDFSIQQVSKLEDVKIAIQCFEEIARFHLLSLHQLTRSGHDNKDFVPQQEREQLSNTLVSLNYYYDDHRGRYQSPNEPEFRAYQLLLQIRGQPQDIPERARALPENICKTEEVYTAIELILLSGRVTGYSKHLLPLYRKLKVGESRFETFWSMMQSSEVDYLTACAAEVSFNLVRSHTLETMSKTFRSGPKLKLDDFSLEELTFSLGFDTVEQTQSVLESCDVPITQRKNGSFYIDLEKIGGPIPKDAFSSKEQQFSKRLVEDKRQGQFLDAVIKGYDLAYCKKHGLVETSYGGSESEVDEMEQVFSDEEGKGLFVDGSNPKNDMASTSALFKLGAGTSTGFAPQTNGSLPSASSFPKEIATAPGSFGQPTKPGFPSSLSAQDNPFTSTRNQQNPFTSTLASQPPQLGPFASTANSQPAAPNPFKSPANTTAQATSTKSSFNLSNGLKPATQANADISASSFPKPASPTSKSFGQPSEWTTSASQEVSIMPRNGTTESSTPSLFQPANPSLSASEKAPAPIGAGSQEALFTFKKPSLPSTSTLFKPGSSGPGAVSQDSNLVLGQPSFSQPNVPVAHESQETSKASSNPLLQAWRNHKEQSSSVSTDSLSIAGKPAKDVSSIFSQAQTSPMHLSKEFLFGTPATNEATPSSEIQQTNGPKASITAEPLFKTPAKSNGYDLGAARENSFAKATQPILKRVNFAEPSESNPQRPGKAPGLFPAKPESDVQPTSALPNDSMQSSKHAPPPASFFPQPETTNVPKSSAAPIVLAAPNNNPAQVHPPSSSFFSQFEGAAQNVAPNSAPAPSKTDPGSSQFSSKPAFPTPVPEPLFKPKFPALATITPSSLEHAVPKPTASSVPRNSANLQKVDISGKPAVPVIKEQTTTSVPLEAPKSSTLDQSAADAQSQSNISRKKEQVLDNVARDLVTGSYGLLEQFVQATMSTIFEESQKKVQKERQRSKLSDIKQRILGYKFLARWREITEKLIERRRAVARRKRMREAAREVREERLSQTSSQISSEVGSPKEVSGSHFFQAGRPKSSSDKYYRPGLNLSALDRFTTNSFQILKKRRSIDKDDERPCGDQSLMSSASGVRQATLTKKQKTSHGNEPLMSGALGVKQITSMQNQKTSDGNEFLMSGALGVRQASPPKKQTAAHHKRSQTVNGAMTSQDGPQANDIIRNAKKRSLIVDPFPASKKRRSLPMGTTLGTSSFVGSTSLINDSLRRKALDIARSLNIRSLSTTRTDYFRLKARGIDPDTPMVPTRQKRSRPADEDNGSLAPSKTRKLSESTSSTLGLSPETQELLSSSLDLSPETRAVIAGKPYQSDIKGLKFNEEEEELFAQSRKLREMLAAETDWMRSTREQYEKEQEDLKNETPAQRRLREFKDTPSRTSIRLLQTGANGFLPDNYWERLDQSAKGKGKTKANFNFGGSIFAPETPTPVMGLAALSNGSKGKEEEFGGINNQGASADDAIEL